MNRDRSLPRPPVAGADDALRAQILATEHWSLLATRSMTWSEIFSRTGTYLTVVSAAVIALSFVAQGSGYDGTLQRLAVILLPVVLMVGIATFLRLVEADVEDAWLVIGMNRIRHAYLELAPDLAPYFITSAHDDAAGMLRTYAFRDRVGLWHWLSGSPLVVGLVNAVLMGALAAIVAQVSGAAGWLQVAIGIAAGVVAAAGLALLAVLRVTRLGSDYRPRFPAEGPQSDGSEASPSDDER